MLTMTANRNTIMPVQITIRDVPEEVRDELERIASRPSISEWLHGVRERKEAAGTRVRPSSILQARDADRT